MQYLHDSGRTAKLTAATIAHLRTEVAARDAVIDRGRVMLMHRQEDMREMRDVLSSPGR